MDKQKNKLQRLPFWDKYRIKKTIGWIIILNIIPLLCILIQRGNEYFNHEPVVSNLIMYGAGWVYNIFIALIFLLIKFVSWCFKESED